MEAAFPGRPWSPGRHGNRRSIPTIVSGRREAHQPSVSVHRSTDVSEEQIGLAKPVTTRALLASGPPRQLRPLLRGRERRLRGVSGTTVQASRVRYLGDDRGCHREAAELDSGRRRHILQPTCLLLIPRSRMGRPSIVCLLALMATIAVACVVPLCALAGNDSSPCFLVQHRLLRI